MADRSLSAGRMGATFQSPKDPKADPCAVVVLGGKEWRLLLITTESSSA